MEKMDYQVLRASWVNLATEAPKENAVIREFQETEALKVNVGSQVLRA